MNFSKLKHRIIFLNPTDLITNTMGETVPRYEPFKPYLPLTLQVENDRPYLSVDSTGNSILVYQDGRPYAHTLALKEYSVAAFVAPMSGREYEESQKLRVETTYKIATRFFPQINATQRILYNGREFEIISVLDLDGKHEELQIIAAEKDKNTTQKFEGDSNG